MRFTNRNNNQESVDNLLPTDRQLCYRRIKWSNLLEKCEQKDETSPKEFDVDFYVETENVDEGSDASSCETIEPIEFEDNAVDDNNFNINEVLNETTKVIAKRKEFWHETGIDQLMDTFSCDNIIGKVSNWLKTNTGGDISQNSPNRNYGTITINEKNIVMEKDSDNSADSVDTAKYILSNRKRRKQRVTMTIKEFRYSTRYSQQQNTNQNDFNRYTRKALGNEKQSIKSADYKAKASPMNKRKSLKNLSPADSSQESSIEEKTPSRPNKTDEKENTQNPHETNSPKQRVHLKSVKKRDERRSRSKTKSLSSTSSSAIQLSSNIKRQSEIYSSSSNLSSPTLIKRKFYKVNEKQSIKSVETSPITSRKSLNISLATDSSQESFVGEKTHSPPNNADKRDNTQISPERQLLLKSVKERDERRSQFKTKSPSSRWKSPSSVIEISSSSSLSSLIPTKRTFHKVNEKQTIKSTDSKVKASPLNGRKSLKFLSSVVGSQQSFVEERTHSPPNKADRKVNTQISHETISPEQRVHLKSVKKRDKKRSWSKNRYSSSSSLSSPIRTKRKFYKVRAKTKSSSNSKRNSDVKCKIATNSPSSKQEAIIKSPIISRLATNVPLDLSSSNTNIVNSTALRSQQSMLHCKEIFISGCEKVAADSTKTSRRSSNAPIVIYSPSKMKTPTNDRLTINEEFLVRTIGSDLKDKFLRNRNNFELECSAKSKLIYLPANDTESDCLRVTDSETDSLTDILEGKMIKDAKIIEIIDLKGTNNICI